MSNHEQFLLSPEYQEAFNVYIGALKAAFAGHGFNDVVLAELQAAGQTPTLLFDNLFLQGQSPVQLPDRLDLLCREMLPEDHRPIPYIPNIRRVMLSFGFADFYFDPFVNMSPGNGIRFPEYRLSFDLKTGRCIPRNLITDRSLGIRPIEQKILQDLSQVPAIISPLSLTYPMAFNSS